MYGEYVINLNILENNLVPGTKGHISTFRAIQWESELFNLNGRPKALCYPFDLPKHQCQGERYRYVIYVMM